MASRIIHPVFVTGGATRIGERIVGRYPFSCPTHGFYHAVEHPYQFADKVFVRDTNERKQRCGKQKALLPASEVETVPDSIASTSVNGKKKRKLIHYCHGNKKRMRYKQFRNMECGITVSGVIESAHRTVIQKRMKLSGQRRSREEDGKHAPITGIIHEQTAGESL